MNHDKTVPLAVLGVVAVLAIVGLVLLFSVARAPAGRVVGTIGIDAPQCATDTDCPSDHYCGSIGKVIRCMPKFQIGTRCYQDSHCSSNTCLSSGYCG